MKLGINKSARISLISMNVFGYKKIIQIINNMNPDITATLI
jgi:hypothetical protein